MRVFDQRTYHYSVEAFANCMISHEEIYERYCRPIGTKKQLKHTAADVYNYTKDAMCLDPWRPLGHSSNHAMNSGAMLMHASYPFPTICAPTTRLHA